MDQDHVEPFIRATFSACFLICEADGEVAHKEQLAFIQALDTRCDLQMDEDDVGEAFQQASEVDTATHYERIAEAIPLPEELRLMILNIAISLIIADGDINDAEIELLPKIADILQVDLSDTEMGSSNDPQDTDDSESIEVTWTISVSDDENLEEIEASDIEDEEVGHSRSIHSDAIEPLGELLHGLASLSAVRFVNSDNEIVALEHGRKLRFIEAQSGKQISEHSVNTHGHKIETSSDGLLLAIFGSVSDSVEIWSVPERKLTGTLPINSVDAAVFDSTGAALYTGTKDGEVFKWSTESLACIFSVKGLFEEVSSLALNPDGNLLAVVGGRLQNSVTILRALDGSKKLELKLPGHVQDVAFHPTAEMLITSSTDGRSKPFQAWHLTNGEMVANFGRSPGRAGSLAKVSFSIDGETLVTTHGSSLRVWSATTFECLCELASEGLLFDGACFTDNGGKVFGFCTGDLEERSGGRCFVWDATTGSVVAVADAFPTGDYVFSLTILNETGDRAVLGAKVDDSARHYTLKLFGLNFSNTPVETGPSDLQPKQMTKQAHAEVLRETVSEMDNAIEDLNKLAADQRQTDLVRQQKENRSDPGAPKSIKPVATSNSPKPKKKGFWARLFGS